MTQAHISDFTPDPSNANRGTERGRALLEQSLRQYGAGRSILVDRNGRIIAGNKTLQTAGEIGLDDVIVVQTDGKQIVAVQRMDLNLATDEAARMLAYADNRVGQIDLDFDPEQLLADMTAGLPLEDFWRQDELDALLADIMPKPEVVDAGPQIDRAEELRQQWQTELGQMWLLDSGKGYPHRLICGDCTDPAVVARVMGGERAQLMVTDPPYGIKRDRGFGGADGFGGNGPPIARRQYADDWDSDRPDKNTFDCLLGAAIHSIIFGGNFFADILPQSTHWLVWDKLNTMPTFGDCELAWTNMGRESVKKYTFEYNGLIGKEKERYHPTQKPLGLICSVLNDYSKQDATILDPFAGSGTTGIACEQLARQARMVELSPAYCAVILQRWADATSCTPVLVEA